ncbi:hypothetical protein PSCICE_16980 [Pseudomonas cichorii]|nr:hypothetical protein PSCICE_16980 [Pseudomonas cichorii]
MNISTIGMGWFYRFRLYGGPLCFGKGGNHGLRFGPGKPGFPRSGIAPWVRAEGPSMALRRLLGVLPRNPLRNTSTRPSLTSQSAVSGRSRFKKRKRKSSLPQS